MINLYSATCFRCGNILVSFILLFVSEVAAARTINITPADMAQERFQAAITLVKSGDTIRLPEGRYHLVKPITIFEENVTVVGQGKQKTLLDFSTSKEGTQAILVRRDGVRLDSFAIINPLGDGVVARNVRRLQLLNLSVSWTEQRIGGYGLYPVLNEDVFIAGCDVSGAKEAGIYVGQTKRARITDNVVSANVVGIDIENSSEVYADKNIATLNSIGIAVTGRPYLIIQHPRDIKIHNNIVKFNNKANLADAQTFAAKLMAGIGIEIIAASELELKNNQIYGHFYSDIYATSFDTIGEYYLGDRLFEPRTFGISIADEHPDQKYDLQQPTNDQLSHRKSGISVKLLRPYPTENMPFHKILCFSNIETAGKFYFHEYLWFTNRRALQC